MKERRRIKLIDVEHTCWPPATKQAHYEDQDGFEAIELRCDGKQAVLIPTDTLDAKTVARIVKAVNNALLDLADIGHAPPAPPATGTEEER